MSALYEEHTAALLGEILTDHQFTWVHSFRGWDKIVETVARSENFGWDTRTLLTDAANVMRTAGKAGELDDQKNTPAVVMADALDEATERLPRRRTDILARYRVPALSDAAAAQDPILATYARSHVEQMHAFVDTYIDQATRNRAPWMVALGDPGTDPRKQALFESAATEVAVSRILADVSDEVTDPCAQLSEVRTAAVTKKIEQIHHSPAAVSVYSSYTADELRTAAASVRRRISGTRLMLGLATGELASATKNSAVGAVDAGVAAAEADAQKIHTVRQARTAHERIRRDPNATDDQINQARAARVAAEAAAPDERSWGAIEIAATGGRAHQGRRDRAAHTDQRVIGQLNTRIARIEKTITADRKRLTLIGTEQRTRPATSTPAGRRRATPDTDHEHAPDTPTHHQEHDRGPEL